MHAVDWLIVFALNGAVIGYGIYLARGTSGSGDWFLAGRALPWWAVGISMFATNIDNADLVGVTGNTYNEGLHIISVYAIGSAVGGILAAFWITPAIYRASFYTNAEYLEARFGPATRVLSALIQIQYRSSMLGMMTWSVHLLLTRLVGLEPVWSWTLIVTLVILAGIYTAWGGLKSVVWTDTMQGVVMMVAAVVIFFAVSSAVGGWSEMVRTLNLHDLGDMTHIGEYHGDDDRTSPYVVVLAWTIIASGYWTVNHTQTMRLMGSRSIWDMKMAALFGVALSLPIMIASASLGMFARALPEYRDLAAAGMKADELYPMLANQFLGPGLKGLVVAGVVAAAISTFDSMGSALSAIFTRDIYARWIVQGRDDAHYVRVGRWATVGVLGLGFLYLPFIIVQENMIQAFTTLIPVFVTPLFVMYVVGVLTRAHRRSGIVGLVCGAIYGVIALYDREALKFEWLPNLDWLPSWFTDRWPALIWSFAITGLAMAVTTLVLGPQPHGEKLTVYKRGWLKRSSEELPKLLEHPFHRAPGWWLNPVWYAIALLAVTFYVVFHLYW